MYIKTKLFVQCNQIMDPLKKPDEGCKLKLMSQYKMQSLQDIAARAVIRECENPLQREKLQLPHPIRIYINQVQEDSIDSVDDRFIKVLECDGERRIDRREWLKEGNEFKLSGWGLCTRFTQLQSVIRFLANGDDDDFKTVELPDVYAIEELPDSRNFYFKILE